MVLPDKLYNILKWVVILVIPASAVFYKTLAGVWHLPLEEEIPDTLYAVELFLGTILGFTGYTYEQKKKEELKQVKVLNGQEDKNEN